MVLWTFPILPSNPPLGQRPRDKTEEEVRKPILHQHPVTEWPILLIFTGIDAPVQTFIKYRVANPIFNYNWYQDSNTGPPGSGCVVLPTTPLCPCVVEVVFCIYTTNRFDDKYVMMYMFMINM